LKEIVENIIFKLIGDHDTEIDPEASFFELLQILDKDIGDKIEVLEELRSVS
jgi:hypothetical protein